MSSCDHTPKLGRSPGSTGRAISLHHPRCGVPLTTLKSDPSSLECSRARFHSLDGYPSQSDRAAHRYYDENARKVCSMPELPTPGAIFPANETAPSQIAVRVGKLRQCSTPDPAPQPLVFPSFPTGALSENSPFRAHGLLERLQLARYGANIIDGEVTVSFADSIACYVGNDFERCENIVTLMDVFCRFLESRRGVGETQITAVIEVLRGTSGWPFDLGDDEVTQAWNLLYLLISFPTDIAPITMSCGTIEEQLHKIFPPTPLHTTPVKFKTTLSDILRAGLKVKPTAFFFEHLQIEKDGNDVTVRLMRASPFSAGFYRSYLHNRAAKALRIEGWVKEVIASTFALFGNKFYDKTAHDLNLSDSAGPEEFNIMKTLFREFKNTSPKLLAHRAIELENLVRSRRAFWPTLRRDLRRQRKEQPFAFWGAILALFFGICTVIQTVASVWALAAPSSPQASQTMPGNVMNGMRILGSPWLTCMSSEENLAATKGNATVSCLLHIGIQ
ncbi:hypothetical protein BD410DRAFT_825792 [Rickenella mellea]|uniref:Uncharacterized protein n=1 Tax=Rickenella mellea TaxID=50990 RepID=A0A4Y7QHJ1_9AGAM|nr:hypothetical protein BD410DRAFT_825792 [Rickenella mellea]